MPIVAHGLPASNILTHNDSIDFLLSPRSHYILPTNKDKTPTIASEGFLILVGRARFELATNGLKDL
jgi:hypothetical protein